MRLRDYDPVKVHAYVLAAAAAVCIVASEPDLYADKRSEALMFTALHFFIRENFHNGKFSWVFCAAAAIHGCDRAFGYGMFQGGWPGIDSEMSYYENDLLLWKATAASTLGFAAAVSVCKDMIMIGKDMYAGKYDVEEVHNDAEVGQER